MNRVPLLLVALLFACPGRGGPPASPDPGLAGPTIGTCAEPPGGDGELDEPGPGGDPAVRDALAKARAALVARHGEGEAARIDRGLAQVARYWRPSDGDAAELGAFVGEAFVPRGPGLDALFGRLEFGLERLNGLLNSLARDLKWGLDVDQGPELPVDTWLAGLDPFAHVAEDLFASKLFFVVLLNFPQTTLEARLAGGGSWDRRQWAEARLGEGRMPDRQVDRVPATVKQRIHEAEVRAEGYINGYNFFLHHVLTPDGARLFPAGLRLISHWGLRDELKVQYGDARGLERQRLILDVMLAVVRQEVPAAVVNNPRVDWTPASGAVVASTVKDVEPPAGAAAEASAAREPDTRYARWLDNFRAVREADAHDPLFPTYLDRRFPRDREMPLAEVRRLLVSVLEAPQGKDVARVISARLGRPLEPFDIWYDGFKPDARRNPARLDAITKKRYPTAKAFADLLPDTLVALGFSRDRALFLARNIAVDPSRGPGHAMGPMRRDDQAHLRTRVGADGMDYKGFNIAIHELGHNVEQVFSTVAIDHTLLQGVPNNAFTEAMAFVFQARDLEVLGVTRPSPEDWPLEVLDAFWATREIAGVALVDIAVWEWLYAHPEATAGELRQAVVAAAGDVWNRYYADLLGRKDLPLLGIYSHLIAYPLYLADYPMGHIVAFQIEEHLRRKGVPIGREIERMTKLGRLTPDLWMREAVGAPLSTEPLLRATAEALKVVEAAPKRPAGK